MKSVITLQPKERLAISDVEQKVKNARNSNDYVLVRFGRKGEFIKLTFSKDQTYTIGYNFWNMEFQVKLNIILKQYPKTVTGTLSNWLCTWVNKLNR